MKKYILSKGFLAGLLTLALCLTCFGYVKASAEDEKPAAPSPVSATYTASTNEINAVANSVIYVLKAEKSNAIKAGSTSYTVDNTGKIAAVDLGIKATNKNVYLYVCDKEFEENATSIDANLIIKAQAAKKVVGVIDYTKIDTPDATDVLSITATDASKKAIENPVAIWCDEIDGTYKASTEFTGSELKKMLDADGGVIFVKMQGVDGASGTAQFASKAIKVKIAKPANEPKIKIDVKKDTIALKNGFDFALATKSGETYTDGIWYTILPVLKDAKIKTADNSIVATSTFKPVDKKDDAAKNDTGSATVSYTQYKFKALSFETLIAKLGDDAKGDFILAVRKSATAKKPASKVTHIEIADQTAAPIVYTEYNVKDEYLIATASDFDKKGFTVGTVVNYNGKEGTEGYDDSFKLKTTAGEGADKNAAAYEFTVVNVADIDTIDWTSVSWKKLDPAKTKITSKLKSKYNTSAKSGITVTLKAGNMPQELEITEGEVPAAATTALLIRRAGVKGDASVRPSDYIKLFVLKSGKTYSLYSTVANGEEAFPYTVEFYKYVSGEWKIDDTLTITGWGKASNENVEFPAVEKADFFKYDGSDIGDKCTFTEKKYTVEVADAAVTEKIAIREYANIKINVKTQVGDAAAVDGKAVTVANGQIGGSGNFFYVGDECKVPVAAPAKPDGASDADPEITVSTGGAYADETLTVTPGSANNVEITITFKYTAAPEG